MHDILSAFINSHSLQLKVFYRGNQLIFCFRVMNGVNIGLHFIPNDFYRAQIGRQSWPEVGIEVHIHLPQKFHRHFASMTGRSIGNQMVIPIWIGFCNKRKDRFLYDMTLVGAIHSSFLFFSLFASVWKDNLYINWTPP